MKKTTLIGTVALLASIAPATAAQAGTVTLNKTCFARASDGGEPIQVSGSGFGASQQLTLSGNGVFATVVTDAAGNFVTQVEAPPTGTTGARSSSFANNTLSVENAADPAQNTSVAYRVANFAYEASAAAKPRAGRTFRFSGFPRGATIYAHYRFGGRSIGTVKLGRAKGDCGTLSKRTATIPRKFRLRYGRWSIQWDATRRYSSKNRPRMGISFRVYKRYTYR